MKLFELAAICSTVLFISLWRYTSHYSWHDLDLTLDHLDLWDNKVMEEVRCLSGKSSVKLDYLISNISVVEQFVFIVNGITLSKHKVFMFKNYGKANVSLR